jgi:hypothetical protein
VNSKTIYLSFGEEIESLFIMLIRIEDTFKLKHINVDTNIFYDIEMNSWVVKLTSDYNEL